MTFILYWTHSCLLTHRGIALWIDCEPDTTGVIRRPIFQLITLSVGRENLRDRERVARTTSVRPLVRRLIKDGLQAVLTHLQFCEFETSALCDL